MQLTWFEEVGWVGGGGGGGGIQLRITGRSVICS